MRIRGLYVRVIDGSKISQGHTKTCTAQRGIHDFDRAAVLFGTGPNREQSKARPGLFRRIKRSENLLVLLLGEPHSGVVYFENATIRLSIQANFDRPLSVNARQNPRTQTSLRG